MSHSPTLRTVAPPLVIASAVAAAACAGRWLGEATGGLPVSPALGVAVGGLMACPRAWPPVLAVLLASRLGLATIPAVLVAWGVLTAASCAALTLWLRRTEREAPDRASAALLLGASAVAVGAGAMAAIVAQTVAVVAPGAALWFGVHWAMGDLGAILLLAPVTRAIGEQARTRLRSTRTPAASPTPSASRATSPADPAGTTADARADGPAPAPALVKDPATYGVALHAVPGALTFRWERARSRILADAAALDALLDAAVGRPLEDVTAGRHARSTMPVDLPAVDVTRLVHAVERATPSADLRALRRAIVTLRRSRAPVDLRVRLAPPTLASDEPADRPARTRPFRLRAWGTFRANGRLTHIDGVLEDLTREVAREDAAREANDLLRAELDRARIALLAQADERRLAADLRARIATAQERCDALLGVVDEDADGRFGDRIADALVDLGADLRRARRISQQLVQAADTSASTGPGGTPRFDGSADAARAPAHEPARVHEPTLVYEPAPVCEPAPAVDPAPAPVPRRPARRPVRRSPGAISVSSLLRDS